MSLRHLDMRIRPAGTDDFGTVLHPETNTGNIFHKDGSPMLQDYVRFPGYGKTRSTTNNNYLVDLNPAPKAYVEGMKLSVKIHTNNTGASTININGLGARSIKKSNGNDLSANMLKSNIVYSLIYNGSNFILQGEGGEYGTALAKDVLSGKTIGTDSGIVSGTMPNIGAVSNTIVTQGGSYTIPEGYHNGSGKVSATFGNLIASNIRNGVTIGGVLGNYSGAWSYTKQKPFESVASNLRNKSGVFQVKINKGNAAGRQLKAVICPIFVFADGAEYDQLSRATAPLIWMEDEINSSSAEPIIVGKEQYDIAIFPNNIVMHSDYIALYCEYYLGHYLELARVEVAADVNIHLFYV